MMTRDKVRGMFLGTAIGDAIGLPCEGYTPDEIATKHGRLTHYLSLEGHKWHHGLNTGCTSDDTQLTLAVAEGLISGEFSMSAQVKTHVAALVATTTGWGPTTKNAIRGVANGVSWKESGITGDGVGRGNGVPMKIGPVAAVFLKRLKECDDKTAEQTLTVQAFTFARDLTCMTHRNTMSVIASLAQTMATFYCLSVNTSDFSCGKFADIVHRTGLRIKKSCEASAVFESEKDDITERFAKLVDYQNYTTQRIIDELGGEGKLRFYCYYNMPFTYMFFLQGPQSIETLYDIASAGGDTDSNAAILGSMMGALNGTGVFPKHLVDGLDKRDEILAVADRFCDKFDIN